jgi:hypothetical protein
VESVGVPIFQPGRKKALQIGAIFGTLGVQKAQKSLKRALWVRFEVFKTVFTYYRQSFAFFVIFLQILIDFFSL